MKTTLAERNLGAVYTPGPLARFVIDRLAETGAADWGRWLDPACGEGVFLCEMVDRLSSRLSPHQLPSTVEEFLFGIDIDPTACIRAREAVREAVARHSGPQDPSFFEANVMCRDFLDLDPELEGGFDFVVGNPPYVSAQALTAAEKRRFLEKFQTAWGRLDLYQLFIEQGLQMLKEGGRLTFITPDTWLTANSSRRLRQYVAESFRLRAIERFERHDLFPGVATVPCVSVIERSAKARKNSPAVICRHWHVGAEATQIQLGSTSRLEIAKDGTPWRCQSKRRAAPALRLGDLVERISAGLATGLNGCFVLSADDTHGVEPELLRPAVRGRDVRAGELLDSGRRLLVPYRFEPNEKPSLVDLDEWPGAAAWLEAHREALENRHCVRVWEKSWFDLHDPVVVDLASRPKILCPDLAREPRFAFDSGGLVPLHSAYYLVLREDDGLDPHELVAALNTDAIAKELKRRAPTAKSGYFRLQAQVLRDLPIPPLAAVKPERAEIDALSLVTRPEERAAEALERDAA
jgi:methylase of polypeptide subunit release factors